MPRAAATTPVRRRAARVLVAARTKPGMLVLTWGLSRQGAAACGLVSAQGAGGPVLELELPRRGGVENGAIRARIVDGSTCVAIPAHGSGRWVRESGLWHLEVAGLLCVCVRESGDAVEVLYASTELLGRVGLEGGRYEFEAASVLRG